MTNFVAFMASKKCTLFCFVILLVNLILLTLLSQQTLIFVTVSLGLMFLNLLFCFIKNRGFARKTMTLFHIILLMFIFLAGYSSLYYFAGYVELAEGQAEYKGYQKKMMGILHENRLKDVLLVQNKIITKFIDDRVVEIESNLDFFKKKVIPPFGSQSQPKLL